VAGLFAFPLLVSALLFFLGERDLIYVVGRYVLARKNAGRRRVIADDVVQRLDLAIPILESDDSSPELAQFKWHGTYLRGA
jgi:hypothetical protein